MKKIIEDIAIALIAVVMAAIAVGIIVGAVYFKYRIMRWGLGL